ncbi:MAG: hypothetical protein IJC48_03785 [Clostridia bacterium]|nr:hypothetical protein [Clostridia bacterium]
MNANMETERKYLIEKPDENALAALEDCTYSDIVQTYLLSEEGETNRVRMRSYPNGICEYTNTRKRRVSKMTAIENEIQISKDEYLSLLSKADPERTPVKKRRYVLARGGYLFEIDLYPFWHGQAVMEVELPSESASFTLPSEIKILREVTGDRAYSNASLAKCPPDEDAPQKRDSLNRSAYMS